MAAHSVSFYLWIWSAEVTFERVTRNRFVYVRNTNNCNESLYDRILHAKDMCAIRSREIVIGKKIIGAKKCETLIWKFAQRVCSSYSRLLRSLLVILIRGKYNTPAVNWTLLSYISLVSINYSVITSHLQQKLTIHAHYDSYIRVRRDKYIYTQCTSGYYASGYIRMQRNMKYRRLNSRETWSEIFKK